MDELIVVGVDPGLGGAFAAVSDSRLVGLWDMPIEVMSLSSKKRNRVNAAGVAALMKDIGRYGSVRVVIELVHAMPQQGVSSVFSFGDSFGVLRGVMAALNLPCQFVTPQQWKKKMGCLGKDKDYTRTRALELYPSADLLLKKHVDRADALLMALSTLS